MIRRLILATALVLGMASPALADPPVFTLQGKIDLDVMNGAMDVPDGAVVEIKSPGGNLYATMVITKIFQLRHVHVRVMGWCASGCAIIAIGSHNCSVAPEGRLALHHVIKIAPSELRSWQVSTDETRERLNNQMNDWYVKNGVPGDLVRRMQSDDPNFVLELTRAEINQVGCTLEH